MTKEHIGEVSFSAYCESFKPYNSTWDELSLEAREAWCCAGEAVLHDDDVMKPIVEALSCIDSELEIIKLNLGVES